ncbi:MAG: hypothetical protein AAGC57_07990 [Pseudomonadota bacterium]
MKDIKAEAPHGGGPKASGPRGAARFRAIPLPSGRPILGVTFALADPGILLVGVAAVVLGTNGHGSAAVVAAAATLAFLLIAAGKAAGSARHRRPPPARRVRRQRVFRGGLRLDVPSGSLEAGDILELASGDRVPAGCTLLWSDALALAPDGPEPGEGLRPLQGQRLPAGVMLSAGRCRVQIDAGSTGLPRRPHSPNERARRPAPMLLRLRRTVVVATGLAALVAGAVAGLGHLRGAHSGAGALWLAVALTILAVPPSFLASAGALLSRSARRLAKGGIWVAGGQAFEALGRASFLCLDRETVLTPTAPSLEVHPIAPEGDHALIRTAAIAASGADPSIWQLAAVVRALETATDPSPHPHPDPGGTARALPAGTIGARDPNDPSRFCVISTAESLLEPMAAIARRPDPSAELVAVAETSLDGRGEIGPMRALGLLSVSAPLPDGAAAAIDELRQAGVRTAVMTAEPTARAREIGTTLGLVAPFERVARGQDLAEAAIDGQGQIDNIVRPARIFAEIGPTERALVADSYRRDGHRVLRTASRSPDLVATDAEPMIVTLAIAGQSEDRVLERADGLALTANPEAIANGVAEARRGLYQLQKLLHAQMGFGTGVLLLALGLALTAQPGLPPSAALVAIALLLAALADHGLSVGAPALRPVPTLTRRDGQRLQPPNSVWLGLLVGLSIAGSGLVIARLAPQLGLSDAATEGAILIFLVLSGVGRLLLLRHQGGAGRFGPADLAVWAAAVAVIAGAVALLAVAPTAAVLGLALPHGEALAIVAALALAPVAFEGVLGALIGPRWA